MLLTPDQKLAGILTPLFALRGPHDLGIGDVGALRELVDWAADQGFGLVQLLPINETGNDHSPYNAISSVALDPLTIELNPLSMPDLTEADFTELTAEWDLGKLRRGPINYPVVKRLKLKLLARAFERFSAGSWKKNDSRARKFRAFCQAEKAWLEDYALFRVLMDEHGTECWDTWPATQQTAGNARAWLAAQTASARRPLELKMRGAMYRQWIGWTQWKEAKAHADTRRVALMGDIPFGVSYYSADTWANPEIFDLKWSGGCPPERILEVDAFTKKWGQNWGIPLYRWNVLRKRDFDWWRQRVRKVRDVFHLFRIDHLLGIFRIYSFPWRPERNEEFLPLTEEEAKERTRNQLPHFTPHSDERPKDAESNRRQGEEILHVLLEECGEWRLIGEDLGEVPPYVRPTLQKLGIAGFKIPQWETEPNHTLTPGDRYERVSLVTYATHDHEPLRAMWEGCMREIAAARNDDPASLHRRDMGWAACRNLAAYAGFAVPEITPWSDDVHEKLLGAILHSNSWLCIFMITDLFASRQRFNVPGGISESNWSERLELPVKAWENDEKLTLKMARVRQVMRESERLSPVE
ncbi:MAG: 4-alpha-glucanotransferase [Chthoniobacteraceae bacterium]